MRPARKGDSLIVCRLSLFGERKEEKGRRKKGGRMRKGKGGFVDRVSFIVVRGKEGGKRKEEEGRKNEEGERGIR